MEHRLKESLPQFYQTMKTAFESGGSSDELDPVQRKHLASQLDDLFIGKFCTCGKSIFGTCGTFSVYRTSSQNKGESGPRQYSRCFDFDTPSGEVLVHVDQRCQIIEFEPMYINDLQAEFDAGSKKGEL